MGVQIMRYLDQGEIKSNDIPGMEKELELLEGMKTARGRYMQRTVITAINVKHGAMAHRAGDRAGVFRWAKREYANAKARDMKIMV